MREGLATGGVWWENFNCDDGDDDFDWDGTSAVAPEVVGRIRVRQSRVPATKNKHKRTQPKQLKRVPRKGGSEGALIWGMLFNVN